MEKRFFTGFLRDLAAHRHREAKLLTRLIKSQHDGPARLHERLDADLKAKRIGKAYHGRLIGYLEHIVTMWKTSSNIVDVRDSADWKALPSGGHMRVTHQPADTVPEED